MSIEINVNPYKASSIQKAIDDLKKYRKILVESPQTLVNAVAERFDEILNEQAPVHGMWTHAPEQSDKGYSVVFTFDGEVEFIEFGTGIVGKEHHDGANMDWAEKLPPPYTGYESGHYINPYTHEWRYWNGSRWIVTKGQIANPFIYRSVQQLMEEIPSILKRIIENG